MKKIIEEAGRNTGHGARTEAKVYGPDGNEVVSVRESSKKGNNWVDRFSVDAEIAYLVTVVDFSNSGKDNSYTRVEGNGELSAVQQQKKDFLQQFWPYVPAHALKGWENHEQWKAMAVGFIQFNAGKIPAELGRDLLRYLYRVRSKWEKEFKKEFGHHPAYEVIWGK